MESIPLGILVDRRVIQAAKAGRIPYEDLKLYRQTAPCPICFFSFADLDLPHQAVHAYTFDAQNRLQRRRIALPPVIHYRTIAFGKADRQMAGTLAHIRGWRLYNHPLVSGKWNHCRWLRADPVLRNNVPETRRYDGQRSLAELLARHKAVVIKRIWGSMGVGILCVRRVDGGYTWEHGTGAVHHCRNLAEVVAGLHGQTHGHDYIVQQMLDLARCRGHRFDMRCVVQRDATGAWRFVGSLSKLAGKNRIATNVAQGGAALPTPTVLKEVFGDAAAERMADIERLALQIATLLARRERHLADLGLDMAVTEDGRAWFIEANTRQMRYGFRLTNQRPEYRNSYRLPLEYGFSLLKPRRSKPGEAGMSEPGEAGDSRESPEATQQTPDAKQRTADAKQRTADA